MSSIVHRERHGTASKDLSNRRLLGTEEYDKAYPS